MATLVVAGMDKTFGDFVMSYGDFERCTFGISR